MIIYTAEVNTWGSISVEALAVRETNKCFLVAHSTSIIGTSKYRTVINKTNDRYFKNIPEVLAYLTAEAMPSVEVVIKGWLDSLSQNYTLAKERLEALQALSQAEDNKGKGGQSNAS